MSAIGDYIHLTQSGYENPQPKGSGVLPYGYTNSMISEKEAISVFQNQKNKIKEGISKRGKNSIAKQIQQKIRALQAVGETNSNSNAKQFYQALVNRIQESLNIILNESLKAAPKANSPEELIKNLKESLNKIYTAQNDLQKSGGSVSIEETLIPFSEEIKKLIEDLQNNKINVSKVEDLDKKRKEIEQFVSNFCDIFNNLNTNLETYRLARGVEKTRTLFSIRENTIKGSNSLLESKGIKQKSIVIQNTDSSISISIFEFAQIVRNLVNDLGYSLSKKQGDAAEMVVAAASALGYSSANKTVDRIFNEITNGSNNIWTGKQTGRIFYQNDKNSFAETIEAEIGKGYTYDKDSGLIVSQGASQDKVDVKFYLNSRTPPFNTSVKNYKLNTVKKYGFGGVSGSPFLYLAKEMHNNDFVNHWINSTIWHSDGPGETKDVSCGKHYQLAHRIMKYTLVIIGAIGGVEKLYDSTIKQQDVADYLVWNDPTSNEGMKVYAFSDIFKNAYEDIALDKSGNWSKSYDNNFVTKNWSAGKMLLEAKQEGKNKVFQQMRRRIQKALVYMHQAKISTKFFLEKSTLLGV